MGVTVLIIVVALIAGLILVVRNLERTKFEKDLSDAESKKSKEILKANQDAVAMSADVLAAKLSKHTRGRKTPRVLK